jgi:hypothetical protein
MGKILSRTNRRDAIDDRRPVDSEGFGPLLFLCALIDSSAGCALD